MDMSKRSVLIVDDSPDDRFFLKSLLASKQQFIVLAEARDGQEVIDWLQKGVNIPNLIFLDLKMPGKNGFDVLEWIQHKNIKGLTVAVMSGSWLQEDIVRCMSLGAHAYFKKTSLKHEQEKMLSDLENLLSEAADDDCKV